MPLLEHLGVTVVDERPYEIATGLDRHARWISSFGVRADGQHDPLGDPEVQARVAELFLGVWAGTIENDGLNRLVLRAGLAARDVVIVRALCQYLRQAGVRFTDAYLADTLAANPDAVRLRSRCSTSGSIPPARATTRRRPRSSPSWGASSTRSSASTPTASCARSGTSSRPRCAPTRTAASRTWR